MIKLTAWTRATTVHRGRFEETIFLKLNYLPTNYCSNRLDAPQHGKKKNTEIGWIETAQKKFHHMVSSEREVLDKKSLINTKIIKNFNELGFL